MNLQEHLAAEIQRQMSEKTYLPASLYAPCSDPFQSPLTVNTLTTESCSAKPQGRFVPQTGRTAHLVQQGGCLHEEHLQRGIQSDRRYNPCFAIGDYSGIYCSTFASYQCGIMCIHIILAVSGHRSAAAVLTCPYRYPNVLELMHLFNTLLKVCKMVLQLTNQPFCSSGMVNACHTYLQHQLW